MSLVKRHWVILAGAGAAAVGGPLWLLEPEERVIQAPPGVSVTELGIAPVNGLGLALSAPLFSPSRLPPEATPTPEDAAGTTPAATPAPPMLVGIVSRARGRGVALVKGSNGETVMIAPGDAVDGWALRGIARDSVTFSQGGNDQVVALDFSNKNTTASAQQIPSPPPPGSPLTLPATQHSLGQGGNEVPPRDRAGSSQ